MNKKTKKILIIIGVVMVLGVGAYFTVRYLKSQKEKYTSSAYDNYYVFGEFDKAKKNYQKATKYWYLDSDDKFHYAISESHLGNLDEAITKYQEVAKTDYEKYFTLNNLGNCYRDKEKYKKAKDYYEQAIKIDNTKSFAYINLISLYQNYFKDDEQALKVGDEALTKITNDKDKISVYVMMLSLYSQKDDKEKINELANKILEIDPENNTAKIYLEKNK